LDLDASVLRRLKQRQKREPKPLGQLASELLARALDAERAAHPLAPLRWTAKPLGLKVDLEDKEALRRILDDQ
jgi:hypothetical protein